MQYRYLPAPPPSSSPGQRLTQVSEQLWQSGRSPDGGPQEVPVLQRACSVPAAAAPAHGSASHRRAANEQQPPARGVPLPRPEFRSASQRTVLDPHRAACPVPCCSRSRTYVALAIQDVPLMQGVCQNPFIIHFLGSPVATCQPTHLAHARQDVTTSSLRFPGGCLCPPEWLVHPAACTEGPSSTASQGSPEPPPRKATCLPQRGPVLMLKNYYEQVQNRKQRVGS